jgi:MoaA/NifB/PqqE/SkfB family radical SAM enzyme
LTFEEKVAVLKQCLDIGVLAIDFIGGESHLDPRFEDLVSACRPERTYITLATNGYGFNKEKIKHYKKIGVDKFNISLDSWDPEQHDLFRRRPGAHKHALNTLNICRENGLATTLSVVVYKNYTKDKNFKDLVAFTVKEDIRLAFKLAVPLGEWKMQNDILVTTEDVETLRLLCKNHSNLSRDIYGNADGVCPAFRDFFSITAYGDVMPCNAIHISFGNLHDETLYDVLDRAKSVSYFRDGYPGCLPVENQVFIQECLPKTINASPYPVRADQIFKGLKNEE